MYEQFRSQWVLNGMNNQQRRSCKASLCTWGWWWIFTWNSQTEDRNHHEICDSALIKFSKVDPDLQKALQKLAADPVVHISLLAASLVQPLPPHSSPAASWLQHLRIQVLPQQGHSLLAMPYAFGTALDSFAWWSHCQVLLNPSLLQLVLSSLPSLPPLVICVDDQSGTWFINCLSWPSGNHKYWLLQNHIIDNTRNTSTIYKHWCSFFQTLQSETPWLASCRGNLCRTICIWRNKIISWEFSSGSWSLPPVSRHHGVWPMKCLTSFFFLGTGMEEHHLRRRGILQIFK